MEIGRYYQISNNYHGYIATIPSEPLPLEQDLYAGGVVKASKLVASPGMFDRDLKLFFNGGGKYYNPSLAMASRLFALYGLRKTLTLEQLHQFSRANAAIKPDGLTDWETACLMWMHRFITKRMEKEKA
jgi:hypothetical protein